MNKIRQVWRWSAILSLSATTAAVGLAAAGMEDDWFLQDFEDRIAEVNDGQLVFLSSPPDQSVHYHQNTLTLDDRSLKDGWARLVQCHDNLDPVPRAEVTFRRDALRNLAVTERQNIDRAWVEGATVQLKGVRPGAHLCLRAESRVVHDNNDGSYSVRNGPYMRRFLDGYYPMRVSVEVRYPCDRLRLVSSSPAAQKGFQVTQRRCRVYLDAWFEGRLNTELRFVDGRPAP